MTREDHDHLAQCCLSLKHLLDRKEVLDESEFSRFIDRLVWAINASPGGNLTDQQMLEWRGAIIAELPAPLNSELANRLSLATMDKHAAFANAPFDFDRFVKGCRGE